MAYGLKACSCHPLKGMGLIIQVTNKNQENWNVKGNFTEIKTENENSLPQFSLYFNRFSLNNWPAGPASWNSYWHEIFWTWTSRYFERYLRVFATSEKDAMSDACVLSYSCRHLDR